MTPDTLHKRPQRTGYRLGELGVEHPWLLPNAAAADAFRAAVDDLLDGRAARYRRLWAYYDNPMRVDPDAADAPPYRQAQEWGLPPRLTGRSAGREPFADAPLGLGRKEVVVENDIAWRVDAGVDFLFGRQIVLESAAADVGRAKVIGELLRGVIAANGGLAFFQQMALVGAVYGGVDVLVKFDAGRAAMLGLDPDDDAGRAACNTSTLGGRAVESDDAETRPTIQQLASLIRWRSSSPRGRCRYSTPATPATCWPTPSSTAPRASPPTAPRQPSRPAPTGCDDSSPRPPWPTKRA